MIPAEIIGKKRDKQTLSKEDIFAFIDGYMENTVSDAQMASLLMAINLNGMNFSETKLLTEAYLQYGEKISFDFPTVDKHSTGGVGDKISLILAPLVASFGAKVPMMAGRGLGHTGGTIDKLESIPGFRTDLSLEEFKKQIETIGVAIIGQTPNIAPVDKRIYALRDVTGTVPSIPLITASILSKKIAEGSQNFVFDVKYGDAAFMKTKEDAEKLGQSLVNTLLEFGRKAVVIYSEMTNPLGEKIGNWLEVEESIDVLQGKGPNDIKELTLDCAKEMLTLVGINKSKAEIEENLTNGKAYQKFEEIISKQGGNLSFLKTKGANPYKCEVTEITSIKRGLLHSINARKIGFLNIQILAGRKSPQDTISMGTGISCQSSPGDLVDQGQVLAKIYAENKIGNESDLYKEFLSCFQID